MEIDQCVSNEMKIDLSFLLSIPLPDGLLLTQHVSCSTKCLSLSTDPNRSLIIHSETFRISALLFKTMLSEMRIFSFGFDAFEPVFVFVLVVLEFEILRPDNIPLINK